MSSTRERRAERSRRRARGRTCRPACAPSRSKRVAVAGMRSCIALPSSSQTCGSRAPGQVRRLVVAEADARAARHVGDDRRIDIAVAELGADHLVGLALLDIGDRGEVVARRRPSGVLSRMFGRYMRAPFAPARARHSATRRHCARRSGAARSRRRRAGPARPSPAASPASFHDRSMASPTPVFMPSPPVGMTRCTASPARNTRPSPVAVGEQQVLPPRIARQHLVFDRNADRLLELRRHVLVAARPTACSVQCCVESCMIRNVALVVGDVVVAACRGRCRSGSCRTARRSGKSAWRSSSRLPSPRSAMPSCLRTALAPPSQPTR